MASLPPAGRKQFIPFITAFVLFLLLIVAGIVGNIRTGNYGAVPIVFGAIALGAVILFVGISFNHRRVRQMFQDPTPNRLIAWYHASVRRVPNADAIAAYLSAIAASIYGDFIKARRELDGVDWDKMPKSLQGNRLHVLALIALLEKDDRTEALQLAEEASALEKTTPGGGMPVLHHAVRLAAGAPEPDSVVFLRQAAGRTSGVMPAIAVWALIVSKEREGKPADAAEWRAKLERIAPHFQVSVP